MSIINKMLQDLDRREARADPDTTLVQQVRSVQAPRSDREWFWRIVAALMVAALAWVAWIAWQLQPRPSIATDQAFNAAQNAQRKAVAAPAAAPAPAPVATPAPAMVAGQKPVPVEAKPAEPKAAEAKPSEPKAAEPKAAEPAVAAANPAPQVARTADAVAKPAPRSKPAVVALPEPKPAAAPARPASEAPRVTLNALDVPAPRILAGPPSAPARVEKRDRVRTPEERAELEFRRGAALLNQGRAIEAEESFAAALSLAPGHEAARQALVALNLEQRRTEEARRLLQEGIALNPAQARFGAVLARIYLERRNYAAALDAVNAVRMPEQGGAELHFMRGSALQKLGRHAEAVDALQNVVRLEPQNGAAWVTLAISLETLGRRNDAGAAYRRAAGLESLGAEARDYAEQRARQLQ